MFELTRAFNITICASRTPITPQHYTPKNAPPAKLLAASLRASGANGRAYNSVRHEGGECAALFYPDLASGAIQGRHLDYQWDGKRVGLLSGSGEWGGFSYSRVMAHLRYRLKSNSAKITVVQSLFATLGVNELPPFVVKLAV